MYIYVPAIIFRITQPFVRSRLEYGCAVFSSARKSYLKKLEPIQNQGLMICLGAFRTFPMQSLHVEANEPPLYLTFDKLCIQYALKLRSNPVNPAYDVVFNPLDYYDLYDKKPSAIRSFGHSVEEDLSVVCPQLDLIQTVSLPDDPPWTIQKLHIDLNLTQQKKHLGDDRLFQSLFAQLKGYPDHRAIYTDGSKAENKVAAAAISNNLSAQVKLPGNVSIFTAELQALKLAFNIIKNCD